MFCFIESNGQPSTLLLLKARADGLRHVLMVEERQFYFDVSLPSAHCRRRMGNYSESPMDRLIKEYGTVFQDFDDLTLARWMCQTLGQVSGRAWRLSHPLIGAYRLAAQLGQERQIWLKRLAT